MPCVTTIDWAATGSMLQGIGTLAGVGAVVWAAIHGANAWRKQKLAERRSEQAERILTATYMAHRALSRIRNPLISPEERSKRLNIAEDDRIVIVECKPMARALFGEDLEVSLSKLDDTFWTIDAANDTDLHDVENYTEHTRKVQDIIWDSWSKERNEFEQAIDNIVKHIEDTCVPALRLELGKRRWFGS